MADQFDILDQLHDRLQTAEADLATAKEAATRIGEIEAEIERLDAALKALGSPQTPSGRKRIGDGAAKRRKPKSTMPAVPVGQAATAPQCSECHGFRTRGTATTPCTAIFTSSTEGCDAHVCGACWASHQARWHREAANA